VHWWIFKPRILRRIQEKTWRHQESNLRPTVEEIEKLPPYYVTIVVQFVVFILFESVLSTLLFTTGAPPQLGATSHCHARGAPPHRATSSINEKLKNKHQANQGEGGSNPRPSASRGTTTTSPPLRLFGWIWLYFVAYTNDKASGLHGSTGMVELLRRAPHGARWACFPLFFFLIYN
jgi:hypothetical protein